jgi:hypothetical protein
MTFDTVMTETPNAFAMTFSVTADMFDLPESQLIGISRSAKKGNLTASEWYEIGLIRRADYHSMRLTARYLKNDREFAFHSAHNCSIDSVWVVLAVLEISPHES